MAENAGQDIVDRLRGAASFAREFGIPQSADIHDCAAAEIEKLRHGRDTLVWFAEVWLLGPGRDERGSMAWNFFNGVAHPPRLRTEIETAP